MSRRPAPQALVSAPNPGHTHPDPCTRGGAADDPSPALKGTLSPSDGERDRARGAMSVPWPTPILRDGSGAVRLYQNETGFSTAWARRRRYSSREMVTPPSCVVIGVSIRSEER